VQILTLCFLLFTSDKGGCVCFRSHSRVRWSVSEQDYSNSCMDLDEMLFVDRCRDMDELITFEPEPYHSPYAGTGLLPPVSYRLRHFAAWPSLSYFSAFSVSICAKLASSILMILMREHNTATEPNFRKSLSKCRICRRKTVTCLFRMSTSPTLQLASIDQ